MNSKNKKKISIEILSNHKCVLGENPIWVKELNSIFWVDINSKKLFAHNLSTKITKILKLKYEVGFLSYYKKNTFIIGAKDKIRSYNTKSKKYKILANIPNFNQNYRTNDCKCDKSGSLWFGILDKNKKKNSGSLNKINKYLNVQKIYHGFTTPNGPAFNSSNSIMYFSDSSKKIIYKVLLKVKNPVSKKIFIKFKKNYGSPDGMTIDRLNNLWVCFYRTGKLICFSKNKKILKIIHFPTNFITSCAFGGLNLNYLFVTSATKDLSQDHNDQYAGKTFKIDVGRLGMELPRMKIHSHV